MRGCLFISERCLMPALNSSAMAVLSGAHGRSTAVAPAILAAVEGMGEGRAVRPCAPPSHPIRFIASSLQVPGVVADPEHAAELAQDVGYFVQDFGRRRTAQPEPVYGYG